MEIKRLTQKHIEDVIKDTQFYVFPGTTVTVCLLTLKNDAKVIGHNYGAIDTEQQDWAQGRFEAKAQALEKVWGLVGYALRQRLHDTPKAKIRICGLDCHQGGPDCNGYCIGKASHAKLLA